MDDRSLRHFVYQLLNPADRDSALSRLVNALIITLVVTNIFAMAMHTDVALADRYGEIFFAFELFSVVFLTLEYALIVWTAPEGDEFVARSDYIRSTDSLIDLLAILPFYVGFFIDLDLRVLIALRLIRLFKLIRYFSPLAVMASVLRAEARAFVAAMMVMGILVFVSATGIYFFEHALQPQVLGSIPQAMWWSIVTLTTLGYGDVVPVSLGGRIFAGVMTVFAVGVVALPAGMLASRFSEELHKRKNDFSVLINRLASDGELNLKDKAELERERIRLCLSESDVALLLKRAAAESAESAGTASSCPHCGASL